MKSYKDFFKGKKVTVMGLGLLGKGLGDAKFLAECGAIVTVTDLKTKEQLASSLNALRRFKNITYVLGEHRLEDFENRDFILKAQGVPLDSPYIAHARAKKIPIWMDDVLFMKLAPWVKIVGITGTRGKTTVTSLIYHILSSFAKASTGRGKSGKRVHLGGNIKGVATLALLKKAKPGDIAVLELSSWQLQGFGDHKMSPNISVFTNFMPDHMNYYKNDIKLYFVDKANIFKYQKADDVLIIEKDLAKLISKSYRNKSVVVHQTSPLLEKWKLPLVGGHNRANVLLAVEAARALKIPLTKIKTAVESFKAVPGRLALAKKIRGIQIYNDNNSTTPEATLAAINSFPKEKIVLIMGGANKNLDMTALMKELPYLKQVILLPGTGTDTLPSTLSAKKITSLQEAVAEAMKSAQKGDIVLFSPAFASFGMFTNEYDREDQFLKIIKKLK